MRSKRWGRNMNEIVRNQTSSTNTAIMIAAASAVLAAGNIFWPDPTRPAYRRFANSSYSDVTRLMRSATVSMPLSFQVQISKIYASLADGQQELGREFTAIWDANLDALYEA